MDHPIIIIKGALQSCRAAMNGQLNKHVLNPWLASAISFALITFFFAGASLIYTQATTSNKRAAQSKVIRMMVPNPGETKGETQSQKAG